MVSVVIPTYNEEKIIEKTLKQLPKLQIIVADGSSTDNTVKIANKYAKVIVTKKGTIAKSRNIGARYAKGDIIVFLDADVTIPDVNNFFRTIENEFSDKNLVGAIVNIQYDPKMSGYFDRFFQNTYTLIFKLLIKLNMGISRGVCQIVRTDSFNKIKGYNEKLVTNEDLDLYRRLNKIGKLKFLNLTVYESPRRFHQQGYLKSFLGAIINIIFYFIRKKSYSEEWTAYR